MTTWFQQQIEPHGVVLNRSKSYVLFPSRISINPCPGADRVILAHTQPTVASADFPSAVDVSGPALIAYQVLVLADAKAATTSPNLATTLGNLATTPYAVELCGELKKLTEFVSSPQLVEMMGTLWV